MLRRCFLRSVAAAPAAGLMETPLVLLPAALAQPPGGMPAPDPFQPTEAANSPLGSAKGIHPGRVVWLRDGAATSWDGVTGRWWDDAHTDQRAVSLMTSRLLQGLTGRKNDKQSWDALFRHFNETHNSGHAGYKPGERIAIKVNCNQDRSAEWGVAATAPAPPGAPPSQGQAKRPGVLPADL